MKKNNYPKNSMQDAISFISYRVKDFLEMGGYPEKCSWEAKCIIDNIEANLKTVKFEEKRQEVAFVLQGLENSLGSFLWYVMGEEKRQYLINRIVEEFQKLCEGIETIK